VMDRLPSHDGLGALIAGHLAVASVGRVTVPDPDGPPLVQLGQLTDPSDLDGLSVVAREALDLMHAPVMRSARGAAFVDDQGTSIDELADAAALRAWLPSHLGGYHHASASCRIGVCLADDGSLIDYEGLFVADASAFAGVPARNPYLSVVRQAERLATGWRSQSP